MEETSPKIGITTIVWIFQVRDWIQKKISEDPEIRGLVPLITYIIASDTTYIWGLERVCSIWKSSLEPSNLAILPRDLDLQLTYPVYKYRAQKDNVEGFLILQKSRSRCFLCRQSQRMSIVYLLVFSMSSLRSLSTCCVRESVSNEEDLRWASDRDSPPGPAGLIRFEFASASPPPSGTSMLLAS